MKRFKNGMILAISVLLWIVGVFILKTMDAPNQHLLSLGYICIGFGCGVFGHGMGNILSEKALKNDPQMKKQMEIEQNDERNIAISTRAKAKGYDAMNFVFVATITAYAIMGSDLFYVLILVAAYLFVHGYTIYYHVKYSKEM